MEPFPWTDLLVIAGLILLNGLFAMSELAIVSVRPARLRIAAEQGSRAARVALALEADPGRFLATVQIGITLVGIIAGAYSGARLGLPVGERLAWLGVPTGLAAEAGFVLVIGLVTYLSLVVGELVPKQIGLRAAERIALVMALPMLALSRLAAPLVWLLDASSSALLRLLRIRQSGERTITAEELQMIFADATRSGAIDEDERAIMAGAMRLAERPVREFMTPRPEIDWIDRAASEDALREAIARSPHALLPVADGSPDTMLGVVKVREVLALMLAGQPVLLADLLHKPAVVPDRLDALEALRLLQQSGVGVAMVHDEYGHLEGIVTPADLLRALVGSFASHQDAGDEPELVERTDGSLLVSGAMPVDDLAGRIGLALPADRDFATVAGYVLWVLERIPAIGDSFGQQAWRFEVVDMDGHRIDRLLVSREG